MRSFRRTWIYHPPDNDLIPPERAEEMGYVLSTKGDVLVAMGGGYIEERPDDIRLASTGLEDSKDNEIVEGHIVQWDDFTYTGVICWRKDRWHAKVAEDMWFNNFNNGDYYEGDKMVWYGLHIIGHVFTDPDLVPDGFDREAYFNGE